MAGAIVQAVTLATDINVGSAWEYFSSPIVKALSFQCMDVKDFHLMRRCHLARREICKYRELLNILQIPDIGEEDE